MTQSITLYDCMLLSVKSMVGTPEYTWEEPKPCSDKVTRVLGKELALILVVMMQQIFIAVVMADEGEKFLEQAIVWLQRQQEKLVDGFTVEYKDQEYSFVVEFIDR